MLSSLVSLVADIAATCRGYEMVGITVVLMPCTIRPDDADVWRSFPSISCSLSVNTLYWVSHELFMSNHTPSDLTGDVSFSATRPLGWAGVGPHVIGMLLPFGLTTCSSDLSPFRSMPWNRQKVSHILITSCVSDPLWFVQVASSMKTLATISAFSSVGAPSSSRRSIVVADIW